MWFKNVQLYNFPENLSYTAQELADKLEQMIFAPSLATLPLNTGWVSPMDHEHAPLVYAAGERMLICLQLEEKILPATVVRQELAEKVKKLEIERDRKISGREKYAIKEELCLTLLPRAFAKKSKIYAYLDLKKHWLILDTASANKTQIFLTTLDKVLPDLVLTTPEMKKISPIMTLWLQGQQPDFITIGQNCLLQDPRQESRTIRCKQQDLSAKSIQNLLKDGYEVNQLALDWQEQVLFTLTNNFFMRSLKFQDAVLQLAKDDTAENEDESFAADFMIMTEILTKVLDDFLGNFKC
ncbi:MAG: hypothetical protein A2X78_01015 [Gammaproteobacteria bacterium GWE2_37_16]|nr:MAG: hypothetical protein A2X78_01015 [Gammaproteobacteria bacterium GWE2_37_16]